jgi:SAM-dependent methyltransferase
MLEDVPSPIDLRLIDDALEWERSAMQRRPWRTEFFARFAEEIAASRPAPGRVLELGSGPGFLALHLLKALPGVSYVLLDFSAAMHALAKARLGEMASGAVFVERSFKAPGWTAGLGRFDAVVTHQAVHELRHKRHAPALHRQAHALLAPGGSYLVCDHFVGEGGMANDQLYMTIEEQKQALVDAGFASVTQVMCKGSLVLHHARGEPQATG